MDLEVEVNNLEPMLVKNPVRPYPSVFPVRNCFPFPDHIPENTLRNIQSFHSVNIVNGKLTGKFLLL
jgi:hypothetical protein